MSAKIPSVESNHAAQFSMHVSGIPGRRAFPRVPNTRPGNRGTRSEDGLVVKRSFLALSALRKRAIHHLLRGWAYQARGPSMTCSVMFQPAYGPGSATKAQVDVFFCTGTPGRGASMTTVSAGYAHTRFQHHLA